MRSLNRVRRTGLLHRVASARAANNQQQLHPVLPCVRIRVSSGRAGAGSMADVSDVQRQAVRMLITRRANIGTEVEGGWQLALCCIGDLMIKSLEFSPRTPPAARAPTSFRVGRLPAPPCDAYIPVSLVDDERPRNETPQAVA
jgi:hypothetical protein